MNLIGQLEHVIGLVERRAPYSEIVSNLIAMHEGVHGAARAAANEVRLARENATLILVNVKLFAMISKLLADDQQPIPKALDDLAHNHKISHGAKAVEQTAAPFSLSPSGLRMESWAPTAGRFQGAARLVRRH